MRDYLRAFNVLLAVSLLLTTVSCILLPIPIGVGDVLEGEKVTAEQFCFLLDPSTRQVDIVEQLGQPDLIWEKPKVYAYHWRVSDGILFWMVAGYVQGVGGTVQLSSAYVLLIQFDETGKIIRLDRLPMPGFNNYGQTLRDWVSQPIPDNLKLPEELLEIQED